MRIKEFKAIVRIKEFKAIEGTASDVPTLWLDTHSNLYWPVGTPWLIFETAENRRSPRVTRRPW